MFIIVFELVNVDEPVLVNRVRHSKQGKMHINISSIRYYLKDTSNYASCNELDDRC